MILSGNSIIDALRTSWSIYDNVGPINESEWLQCVGPNSIDLRLSSRVLRVVNKGENLVGLHAPADPSDYEEVTLRELDGYTGLWFHPNDFYLGSLTWAIDCSRPFRESYYVQHFANRSTVARLGLFMDLAAAFGDYGFNQSFTLEIRNVSPRPVFVPVGSRVGQVYFLRLDTAPGEIPMSYNTSGHAYTHSHVATPVLPSTGVRAL